MSESNTDDGGPAFPISEYGLLGYNGMSLRDYFAGEALAGDSANLEGAWDDSISDEYLLDRCRLFYRIADAMIEARKPTSPTTETFEAHGLTWFKHTPGDPCPCDRKAWVQVFWDSDFDNDSSGVTERAADWDWECEDRGMRVVGWRYADAP